jgi:hypothetical protein
MALALLAQPVHADPPDHGDQPASGKQEQASLPSAGSMIAPQVAKMEDDLAQLVQKRDSVPAGTLPWLDFQIDARIFTRWLLTQTANSRDQSRAQIAGYLHSTAMLAIVPTIDDFASKQTAGPDSVQTVGLARIHQFTFQLKEAKDTAALDSSAADVAQDILIAITPLQAGVHLPALVPMRPAVSVASSAAQNGPGDQPAPKTVENLAELARQASVSAPLRKQLIAMATLLQQAQADPAQSSEADAIHDELENALGLAAGLQANTAVTAPEREQLESQLCDGLALFSDPRMRGAGQARLAALDQYRQLLGRVEKMRVPPELTDALAPALAWAHENPDQGDKVLSAVEKFVALYLRQAARPPQPGEFAALKPGDPLRRAYEAVGQQFVKARGDFLGDAGDIGRGAGATGAINTGSGPDALGDRVKEMARLEDLLDTLLAMPKTIESLDAFKSRPIGGIERHVNALLITIESPIKSPARDDASRQLLDLNKLALIADELSSSTTDTIPPAVAQAYTGDQIAALETKWKSMVTELASSFSVNQPIDPQKLDRLKAVHILLDALGPAMEMEAAFAKPEGLAKWADWTITPEQAHALIAPFQQAMAAAFSGFISDNPDALADFGHLRSHYEPLMGLLARTSGYADACSALPDDTLGLLSRLATPCDKAPFQDQRFASFIASLAASANGDASVTQIAATTISEHLAR